MFKKTKAFSLLEIILAVALFTIFGAVLLRAMIGIPFDFSNSADRMKAKYLLQEGQEAVVSIRNYDWDALPNTGTYGLDHSSGYWTLTGSSDTVDGFTRTITMTEVNSAKYDVSITVSWTSDEGIAQSKTNEFRVTNWEKLAFIIDSQTDFNNGHLNGVEVVTPGSVQLAPVADYSASTPFVSHDYSGDGNPTKFHLEANKLYVSTTLNAGPEFYLFDVKDVSRGTILEIDGVEIGADVNDFVIDGNYAYLATSEVEVQVVRLHDMSIVDSLDLAETHDANGIDKEGNSLVVVRDQTIDIATAGEVHLINASSPTSLSESSYAVLNYDVYDVAVHNGYAFVVTMNDTSELEVYRLSDMTRVNSYDFSSNDDMISISLSENGRTAYLGRLRSGANQEFFAVDVSSPEVSLGAGDILSSLEIDQDVNDISVHGSQAFLALQDGAKEIGHVNLSSYSFDYTLDLNQATGGRAVAYYGAHIYGGVEHNTETIQALRTASGGWSSPTLIDFNDAGGNQDGFDIVIEGSYAYLGRDSGGSCVAATGDGCEFLIYDISTPTAVTLLGALEIGDDVNDIYVSGNYAYLATSGVELQVVDITTKSAPSLIGSYDADSGSNGMSVWGSGSYVYLGTQGNGGTCNNLTQKKCEFYVLDVSSSSLPTFVSGVEIGTEVTDIQANGVYAYIATPSNSAEIRSIDLSVPALPGSPVSYNHSGSGDPNGMTWDSANNALHVAFTSNGTSNDYSILVFGSGGASPSAVYGLSFNKTMQMVTIAGNYAFLVGEDPNAEIKVIDISILSSPTVVGTLDLNADGNGVATDGTYAFVASENDAQELQVVGTGGASSTLNKEGMYVSEAFDATTTNPSYGLFEWTASGSGGLEFQIRTAATLSGLNTARWVGPGGNPSTTFTSSGSSITKDSLATGGRYIQVAAYLSGDGVTTPVVENITINYTP